MCLEFFNLFLGLPLALLGLGLLAVIIVLLAARSLFASPPKDATYLQNSGFTCPCYAPPAALPEKETE